MEFKDLEKYDFAILIDKSGSMGASDCQGGITRWEQAKRWSKVFAQKCEQYDDDGIDVIMFDDSAVLFEGVTSSKVDELFTKNRPCGSTDTSKALNVIFDKYFSGSESKSLFSFFGKKKESSPRKPMIVVCITDGEPNSKRDVVDTIIRASKKINDDSELGVTFIQVGRDNTARRFLQELDDDLVSEGAKFDIVSCKNDKEMDNTSIEQVLIEAITA